MYLSADTLAKIWFGGTTTNSYWNWLYADALVRARNVFSKGHPLAFAEWLMWADTQTQNTFNKPPTPATAALALICIQPKVNNILRVALRVQFWFWRVLIYFSEFSLQRSESASAKYIKTADLRVLKFKWMFLVHTLYVFTLELGGKEKMEKLSYLEGSKDVHDGSFHREAQNCPSLSAGYHRRGGWGLRNVVVFDTFEKGRRRRSLIWKANKADDLNIAASFVLIYLINLFISLYGFIQNQKRNIWNKADI